MTQPLTFEQKVAQLSFQRSLERTFKNYMNAFDLSEFDKACEAMGKPSIYDRCNSEFYKTLRMLHCVKFKEMGPEIEGELRQKCYAHLGLLPAVLDNYVQEIIPTPLSLPPPIPATKTRWWNR